MSLLAAMAAGRMTGEVRPHEVQPAEPDDRGAGGPATTGMGRHADLSLVDDAKAAKLALNYKAKHDAADATRHG